MRGGLRSGPGSSWTLGVVAGLLLAARVAGAITLDTPAGRWTVGGWVEGYAIVAVDGDSPRQRPQGTLDLQLTGDVHPKARVFLDLRGLVGGPAEHARGAGVQNLSDTFQDISPELDVVEGYVDLFLASVDLRVGMQKFAWGKLDRFQPTDIVNPRRYTDPFVMEEQDAKLGVPAVRASYYPPALPTDLGLSLVWVPVPFPVRFPLEDERWFPPAVRARPEIPIAPRRFGFDADPFTVPNAFGTANVRPAHQLDEGSVGLRAAGLAGGVDWALYFYNGAETAPSFDVSASVVEGTPPDFGSLRATSTLRPEFNRIRLGGGDAALSWEGFTGRLELAYGSDRSFPRQVSDLTTIPNLNRAIAAQGGVERVGQLLSAGRRVPLDLGELFETRDAFQWGLGVDYRWQGWMPLVQLTQTVVLDNTVPLLVPDIDTRLLVVLKKSFLADRLATEIGAAQGLGRSYTSGLARATYTITDHWRVRVGYLLLAGTRNSLVGQYHDNDEAFFQLRFAY